MYILSLLVASAILALFLARYLWARRDVPGVNYLLILVLAAAAWSAAYALELGADDLETKLFWAKVQYIGIVSIAPAWFLFAMLYTDRPTWFTGSPQRLFLLAVVPAITLGLTWTNESHSLIWSQVALDIRSSYSSLDLAYGPWFWFHTVYSYLLLLFGSISLVLLIQQTSNFFRWQVAILLVGLSVPWIANLLSVADLAPFNLDLTPFAFIVAGMAFAFGMFRFRVLDVVPIARWSAFESISDYIIVLNSENRIVDANPVARQLSNPPGIDLVGSRLDQILGHHAELVDLFTDPNPIQGEIPITVDNVPCCFDVRISPLNDQQKSTIGWLVVLRDISQQKKAEEELRLAKAELELTVAKRTSALEDADLKISDELVRRTQVEQRYRELFQDAPVMYVIALEQQGKTIIVDCNQLFLDTLGYEREEALARPMADFYAPGSRTLLDQDYLHRLNEGIQSDERQLLTRQGRVIETLHQESTEFDSERKVYVTRSAFLDVTDAKQLEHRFQRLLESAPDAMVIVNEGGRIVLANNQTEAMFGYTQDELINQPLEILIPMRFRERHLKHLANYVALPKIRPMGREAELWALSRDGREFPVEISLSPLATDEGLLVTSTIRDISKRKQAEVALIESESKFRNIIESSPLGKHIYRLEPDGRLLFLEANPAADKILGIEHVQFVGKTLEQAFPEIVSTDLPDHCRRVAANGGIWSTDAFRYEDEGISGVFEVNVFQTSPGIIAVAFSDITARKQMEEEQIRLMNETKQQREQLRILARKLFKAQENERKDLARELHDRVGQNLAVLDFNVNRVRNLMPFDAPAGSQIHQLEELINASSSILTQTGKTIRDVMADLRPPMLDDYGLKAALDWYGSQFAASQGIAITVSGEKLDPRLSPEIELALFRIAQEAFINIVKHAQATTVTVRLETDPGQDIVRLVIADNGRGFEPTSRAGPADRQSWGLIGMKERAVAVNGHCRIESIPGQGTQVIVEVTP